MDAPKTRIALWLEQEANGAWYVIVSAPGVEIDRIGPYTRAEGDAFISGAKLFAPNYIGARPHYGAALRTRQGGGDE